MPANRKLFLLALLGTLIFTGCGKQQKTDSTPEPSESNPSTSTATASNGESASATTQATEHYSGGSKAPEGEYRPADEFGPAQNVPKPVEPEGMNVESGDGLLKFLGYWTDSVNYGIQTGDFTLASALIADDYDVEQELYIWASEVYDRGGWVVGGRRELVTGEDLLAPQGNGVYYRSGNLNVEDMQAYLDTPGEYVDNSWTVGQPIYFVACFADGKWVISNVESADAG